MIATTDNNSNQPLASLREIQELAIAITAKSLNPAMLRDLRKNKMPARRAEPSHPIWAKFQNVARKVAIVLVL